MPTLKHILDPQHVATLNSKLVEQTIDREISENRLGAFELARGWCLFLDNT